MRFFKSKIFIFTLIAAIILTLVPTLIAAFGGVDLLRSALGTVAKPFVFCASGVANAFNGFVDVFSQYDKLKAENAELKQELKILENKKYDEDILKEQNDWLKGYINVHNQNPEYLLCEARIISREAGNYSTVVTLNRGSVHGIKKNMPIITEYGLLGYVYEIGLDWCKAITITETTETLGVYTDRGGVSGVIENTAELRQQGLCKMMYIEENSNIQIGDRIYTSGGDKSIYPPDLLVGSVSDIEIDSITGAMVAIVTPEVDFTNLNSISNVMVICGYADPSTGGDQ